MTNNPRNDTQNASRAASPEFSSKLLKGNISKNIITLSLPILIANSIANAYYIIDMIFVGRLGPTALAAVSMGGVLMSLTWTVMIGIVISASSFIARNYGQQNQEMINKVVSQIILLVTVISAALFLYGMFGTELSLKLLGADDNVLSLGVTYSKIVFAGSFGIVLLIVINSMFRGSGDTKTPLVTLGISSMINIILDPLLIFGLGPFPELGVTGAAISTVFGQAVGAILCVIFLIKGKSNLKVTAWSLMPDSNVLRSLVNVALPGSTQMFIQSMSSLFIMRLAATYGTAAVAAYGIGLRFDLMVMLPGWALGAGVGTILGQNLGANQPERAEKTGWHGVRIYFFVLFVICSILWAGAEPIVSVFNSDPEVVAVGVEYIHFVAIGYLFLSAALILTMSMNGAGYAVVPMVIIFVTYLMYRIPVAAISTFFDYGIKGLWFAIATSLFLQGVLSVIWFKKGRWKKKRIH